MDSRKYWVGFNLVKGIGAVRMQSILDYFGDIERAWHAPYQSLQETGLSSTLCERIIAVRGSVDLDKYWSNIESKKIKVIIQGDTNYLRLLSEISKSPPVLYCMGELKLEDEWSIAIVGSRKTTHYGRQATEEFSEVLADHHITVVSGLARGVDGIAHQAALNAGGRTIAVLGSGVDNIYPPEHRKLADDISKNGAVISDYPPGTPPDGYNFPPRNRIISGLSRATIVIEAGVSSGALITAEFAADQGRDVYALPGSIYASQSEGTNRLIQQGAKPLLNIRELLQDLQVELIQEHKELRKEYPVDLFEQKILRVLSDKPIHIDEITLSCEMPVSQVTACLSMMELKGLAKQVGGMNYIAIREKKEEYKT